MTVGNLLSGLVGAVIVFSLGVFREWWRNEQERRGLLRLLLAETEHNDEVIRMVIERRKEGNHTPIEELVSDPDMGSLKAQTWHSVQGRAAALLPNNLMMPITSHYSYLETWLTLINSRGVKVSRDSLMRDSLANAAKQEGKPPWSVHGSRNPYRLYLTRTAQSGTKVKEQINEYLNIAWSSHLILSVLDLAESRKTKSRQA